MPTFLITNDDGIHSDGLAALVKEFSHMGTVYVVAPDREQSACGHAITLNHPLRVEEHRVEGAEKAWAVDGTPADGVKLAVDVPLVPTPPDFVISGVNRGPNLGTDVLYSGTVSAAFEAILSGFPALAVSLCEPSQAGYEYASAVTAGLVKEWIRNPLPADTLLNINIPGVPDDQIAGLALACLGRRKYERVFERRVDPRGKVYYWMAGEPLEESETGTDMAAIRMNMVAVTPLHFDLTRRDILGTLGEWLRGVQIR